METADVYIADDGNVAYRRGQNAARLTISDNVDVGTAFLINISAIIKNISAIIKNTEY